ncbi:50S ribosomal protein L22 [Candidatus Micrarchaeota archaeon]|nr:50S ribosomal protein L22 [Candidatus Micrarchaeota archaeon]
MSYSYKIENESDFAKARVEDVNASPKDLAEVCYNIRRKPAEAALQLLEEAKARKRPIRYRAHNTRMAHRKELQGQKGRWPVKCVGIVLKCLESAVANAKERGLSEELVVAHASANKKHSYMRYSSKGRRNISRLETARVEIVLKEKEEGKKKRLEEEKKKKEEKSKKNAAEEKKKKEEQKKAAEKSEASQKKEEKPGAKKEEKAAKPEEKGEKPETAKATPEEKKEAPEPETKKGVEPPEKKAVPKTEKPKPETKGKEEVK